MFFWNVSALKQELIRAPLAPRAALRYLVASVGVLMLLYELEASVAVTRTPIDTVASVAGLVIMFVGTLIAYAANGGDGGRDFLGRYFALGWVLGIRNFVGLLVTMIGVGVLTEMQSPGSLAADNPFNTADAVVSIVFAGIFYWRMVVHMRTLARHS